MQYKLRCLGIKVEKRSELLCDNLSVVVKERRHISLSQDAG
jgi:hypothetical protein